MFPYQNPWVGYIDRSYQQIKQSLIDKFVIKVPEATDLSETNILVILVSMFAGVAEMLNLYIDNMAQEAFVETARRFTSLIKISKLLDYRIRAANDASADITVIAINNATGLPELTTAPYTVPAFSQFSTPSGLVFINTQGVIIPLGSVGTLIPVQQITILTGVNLGTSNGTANQQFDLGTAFVHNSLSLFINSQLWTQVPTLGFSIASDKHFTVEVQTDGHAWLVFGDGINGAIPPGAGVIIGDYYETLGSVANVDERTINTVSPSITLTTANPSTTKIYNELAASGGLPYENIGRLRTSLPLSIRTLMRAVTEQDYEDLARLAPGMGKAVVNWDCGKRVDIYIVPEGGGIAQMPLIMGVKKWFEDKRMITTIVNPLPAGETSLKISMDVTARFRADAVLCLDDVQNALLDYGDYINQAINRRIRMSDIIALIDNLPRVDYLTLTNLGTIPYARPLNHTTQLSWIRETLPKSLAPATWRLSYDSANFLFRVFKDWAFVGNAPLNLPFTDTQQTFTFIPQGGVYTNGMTWTFKTYPFKADIDLDDFSIPITKITDISVVVFEQLNPPI